MSAPAPNAKTGGRDSLESARDSPRSLARGEPLLEEPLAAAVSGVESLAYEELGETLTIVSPEEAKLVGSLLSLGSLSLESLGVESLSVESLSLESLCVPGSGMASRR